MDVDEDAGDHEDAADVDEEAVPVVVLPMVCSFSAMVVIYFFFYSCSNQFHC